MNTLSQLNTLKSMNGPNLPMNGEYPIVRPNQEFRIQIAKNESGPPLGKALTRFELFVKIKITSPV